MGKKDITLKDYFSDCRRYADLLNGSVFCGQQMIKAEELQEAGTVQSKSAGRDICRFRRISLQDKKRRPSVSGYYVGGILGRREVAGGKKPA